MARVYGVLAAEKNDKGFRLAHFAVQSNHLHLVCEGDDARALSRGVQRVTSRIARRANELWGRRGRVFSDRFHARVLRSPRQVRNVLSYVLLNLHKDFAKKGTTLIGVNPFTSGRYFDGWKDRPPSGDPGPGGGAWEEDDDDVPVTRPESWLLRTGWKRWGLISIYERAPRLQD